MNRAIPALLSAVPAHDSLQMRTESAELVHVTLVVFVYSSRCLRSRVEDAALAVGQVCDVLDVGLEKAFVLCIDLEIVGEHLLAALEDGRDTIGSVEFRPWVSLARDLGGNDVGTEDEVSKSISRVTSHDPSVLGSRIATDEGHEVDWLEDLAGPSIIYGACFGEAFASPRLELLEASKWFLL